MAIRLGWYSPINFRPSLVENGQLVEVSGRAFLCDDCARQIGAVVVHADGSFVGVEEGTFSNLRWHSKGYDYVGRDVECLCGKTIDGGEEVYFTVKVVTN